MFSFRAKRWGFRLGGLGLLAVVAAGCGGGSPFGKMPITGKVTYEDGSLIPAARIMVTFVPQIPPADPKTHPRPGVAEVNPADGTFKDVTSLKYADGATIGPNKVQIISFDKQQNITNAVPVIYRQLGTTPLEVEIAPGSSHIELKVRKPG
ncbi:MAG: hypothetical protein U9N87_00650 [Planctomycetota bacterium]|nr:hypothetical protein [Planctomycetota bacterium]